MLLRLLKPFEAGNSQFVVEILLTKVFQVKGDKSLATSIARKR
jgi:hypothetical protein